MAKSKTKWFDAQVKTFYVKKVDGVLFIASELIASDIILDMKKPKHGTPPPAGQGSRGGKQGKKTHRVPRSKAGDREGRGAESPAVQIGSIVKTVAAVKKAVLLYRVGAKGIIAYWLEVGTKLMKPRPWLRPAFKRNAKKIMRLFTRV